MYGMLSNMLKNTLGYPKDIHCTLGGICSQSKSVQWSWLQHDFQWKVECKLTEDWSICCLQVYCDICQLGAPKGRFLYLSGLPLSIKWSWLKWRTRVMNDWHSSDVALVQSDELWRMPMCSSPCMMTCKPCVYPSNKVTFVSATEWNTTISTC